MRSAAQVAEIRRLAECGLGASAIARRTGIPRTTVRDCLARPDQRDGPGRKHLRPIRLEPWQLRITEREPRALLRGLIHSDGSRYVAAVHRRGRSYRYARYSFSNRSDDIKAIFCSHLDLLGIGWTRPNEKDIAVARRADVAALDGFVGPKA